MSKIYVFTPTQRYGGLDVTFASLKAQTEKDFNWIVLDDLVHERLNVYEDMFMEMDLIWGAPPQRREGDYRNLAAAYNAAIELALEDEEGELFVTLQDYIWAPSDGLERFLKLHREQPKALITGLTSITDDPSDDCIQDREGLFTIFKEPVTEPPKEIGWHDSRHVWRGYCRGIQNSDPIEWEANWAAVPMDMIRDGLRWDREYDKGVAYENQDLAIRALLDHGAHVVVDCDNHALSLPHKRYFPWQEKADGEHNNQNWHRERWSGKGVAV